MLSILQTEISLSGGTKGGRILDVFGGDLWYRVSLDLINRYFKVDYKQYLQEALDTEGKSKQLFLDILDVCICETREFFG